MLRALTAGLIVCLIVPAAAGCGDIQLRPPSTDTTTAPSGGETADSPPPQGSGQKWTMPDLRGKNLQEAQDAIQALTDNAVFFSTSTDLTGQDRRQLWDRNWQVCDSTPPPGEMFTVETTVDFGVVRDTEQCP